MEILRDIAQNSPEWHAARLGIPTASQFKTVMATGRGGGESKTRRTYMLKLAGERLTGEPAENFTSAHMDRGHALEGEARELYEFLTEVEVEQVGFIRDAGAGCSPDGLVGADGMLEIKTALPHILIDILDRDTFPPEHRAQVQGQLWIADRAWCDLVIYWPGLPMAKFRAERDAKYQRGIATAVYDFNRELDAVVDRIRGMGAHA